MLFFALWTAAFTAPLAAEELGATAAAAPTDPVQAARDPHRFEDIFAPFVTDTASLSPDGRHLAYSILEGGTLHVVVVAVDDPGMFRTKVAVNSLKAARPNIYEQGGGRQAEYPVRIRQMIWILPTRLLVVTELGSGPALMAFDLDGANARILATSREKDMQGMKFVGRSTEPDSVLIRVPLPVLVGVSGLKPQLFYDYLRLNTVTGKFTEIKEAVALDEQNRVKFAARAARGDFRGVDHDVREVAPNKQVSLFENDDAQVRYLALVEGLADPGSFCVVDRERGQIFDLVPRMPGLVPAHASAISFEFTARDGQQVSGELVLPREPKVAHAPLVVFMPSSPGQRMTRGFSREAQAFARMGLASVRFDSFVPRPKPGEPERVRERWLVDEVVRLVDGLPALHPVSKRSVVLFGERQAGYFALRAMQIEPERFIAAVVADPGVSRDQWNDPKRWPARTGKPGGPSGFKRPLLVLANPMSEALGQGIVRSIIREAKAAGAAAEWSKQSMSLSRQGPLGRAAVFREIEGFVNTHVYQFVVKLGDLEFEP
jgi:pimeloyl-ACP methyl ester carboxylesterase